MKTKTVSVPEQITKYTKEQNLTLSEIQQEKFEDTKGIIRIRKSKKNRQHNEQERRDYPKIISLLITPVMLSYYLMTEKGYRTWINTETLEIGTSRIDTVYSNVCIGGVEPGVCVAMYFRKRDVFM